jgi:hypothetical protein
MKKSLTVLSGITALVLASLAFTGKGDEPKYKNLKILPKNITKVQMDSVMHHFTDAMNVKCNFCHVRTADGKEWNFPADDNKHKLIAREMMKMTNDINKKYFDLAGGAKNLDAKLMVTCYTCHNGKKEPLTIPPKKENTRPVPPPGATQPSGGTQNQQ